MTEAWVARELYCPTCLAPKLESTPPNAKAIDYLCSDCNSSYQLKSTKGRIGKTIPDGAYGAMLAAIRNNQTPNLLILRYHPSNWLVSDLIFIPHFAYTEQSIIPRPALKPEARRAGWIGCNIDLTRIASDARIPIIQSSLEIAPQIVRERYQSILPLSGLKSTLRGWPMEVLSLIKRNGWKEFTTTMAYDLENNLRQIFPENHNIRPKIRQQLQILRDLGILNHMSRNCWSVEGVPEKPA